MTVFHFQTKVSEDGSIPIVLPEELRGASVAINVQTGQADNPKPLPKMPISEHVKLITDLLKDGYTDEDIDDLRYLAVLAKHSQHCYAHTD